MNNKEQKGLHIVEENAFDGDMNKSFEELAKLSEGNELLSNMLGSLEIFGTLFEMPEEDFVKIAPSIYQIYVETLNGRETKTEISAVLASNQWQIEDIEKEISVAYLAVDEIEDLEDVKKDFFKQLISALANVIRQVYNLRAVDIPCEIDNEANLPTYARDGDAGMDIVSPKEYTINPGETIIIPTGIKVAIPEGYALLIQPRSGMSVKSKLRIANTPGLIDSGYRDEIGVIVENIEPPFKDIDYDFDENGQIQIKSILHGQSYTIAEGQKFAQMRLVQAPIANLVKVSSVQEIGENRGGGFGHTDVSE